MSIGLYHHPEGMTKAQYDEVISKLEAVGASSPPGRAHHACFGPAGGLMVFDIWDSAEQFEAFGETLGPILAEVGIQGGAPEVMPVENVIEG